MCDEKALQARGFFFVVMTIKLTNTAENASDRVGLQWHRLRIWNGLELVHQDTA